MNRSFSLKIKIYRFCFLLFSFFLLVYLLNVLINGERGVISYNKINYQHSLINDELAFLKNENDKLEDKISRLSPNTLDLDFLDEYLRIKTGKSFKNEIIINLDY